VKIGDRQVGTVGIGGVTYEVGVFAQSVSGAKPSKCADAFTPFGVALVVIAQDPAPIIAGLEIVEPPASP
jgi:hypothetical protein